MEKIGAASAKSRLDNIVTQVVTIYATVLINNSPNTA